MSVASALGRADVNVSLPLGSVSATAEFVCLDSVTQLEEASRAGEDACMDSIEMMEGVLDITGEMMCLLPPQEIMRVAIG